MIRAGAARQGIVLGQRERAPLVQRVRAPLDDAKISERSAGPQAPAFASYASSQGRPTSVVSTTPRLTTAVRRKGSASVALRASTSWSCRRRPAGGSAPMSPLDRDAASKGVRDAQPGVELRGEGVSQARASSDHHRARRPRPRLARAVVPFDDHAVGDQGLARAAATVEQQRSGVLEEAGHCLLFRAVELERGCPAVPRKASTAAKREVSRYHFATPVSESGSGITECLSGDLAARAEKLRERLLELDRVGAAAIDRENAHDRRR